MLVVIMWFWVIVWVVSLIVAVIPTSNKIKLVKIIKLFDGVETTALIIFVSGIVFIIASIGVFGTAALLACSTPIEPEQVEEEYRELVSLKDGTREEGYEFLIMYSSSERDVYSYYYITENGGYRREIIKDDNVTIFEEDNCTPRVTKVTTYTTKSEFLGIKWDERQLIEEGYNIYVPKGSIVREFELDAE